MNSTEKKYAAQISQIMRTARKLKGITQIEASKTLGITQGTLSKLEKGDLVISTPLWFEFCELMKISSRSFLLGYIDTPLPESIDLNEELYPDNTFGLPKRYSYSKGSTVRSLRGLSKYAHDAWGVKKFEAYLETKKVDSDFLFVLPNQINLQFTYDLITTLRETGDLNKESLKTIEFPYSDAAFHGQVGSLLEESKSPKELLKQLIRNMDRYQINFNYSMESSDSEAMIIGKPAPFLAAFDAAREISQSLCELKGLFFEASLRIFSPQKVKIKHTHCFYKGDSDCRYLIPV